MESQIGNGAVGATVRLLSKKQMASELGVSNRTIERWDSIGYIQCIRIGGRVYFSYAEVVRIRDRFLEGHQRDSRIRYAGDITDKYQGRFDNRR
jgi:excisionase family DNA binding protein